jgi:hypothetical protein
VEKTQNELMKISDVFSKKFQKLADVIKNPWDDPVLANLLHDNNAAIGQEGNTLILTNPFCNNFFSRN